ncbi:PREDICTED: latrophilin Cirl-like [Ceratosolen solmsi marchali]|uniref:Latrophilin Cirl-like n=1 Tax=Ceratosolen solmsi marchali TaxID=326594 RepID=A0AAJ7E152_9HYME|nr:PREDICTED: latrophilin Cirl-like [Ceratosolen solmsi marchali]
MESRKDRWKIFFQDFVLAWLCISSSVLARNIERYDTAYECEGKTLRIECREGELIHLIRANYGRFSITICNEHGNTDWSVNCMSPKSFRVLYNKCNQQQNCSIVASTSHFGDPCPNTLKYLEAHYQCISASTTTTTTWRPSPPWLLTSQSSIWSTTSPGNAIISRAPFGISTSATASTAAQSSQRPENGFSITAPSVGSAPRSVPLSLSSNMLYTIKSNTFSIKIRTTLKTWTDGEFIENEDEAEEENIISLVKSNRTPGSTVMHETTVKPSPPQQSEMPFTSTIAPWKTSHRTPAGNDLLLLCPGRFARKLTWNETRLGEVAVQNCPGGANGLARWQCVRTVSSGFERAIWQRDTPDLSECRSVWLSSLEKRVQEGEVILGVSSDLSQVTNNSRELYGGDMLITTKILKNMADRMNQDIQTYLDLGQREVSVAELLQGAVTTGSNLLDRAQSASWKDLSHREQMVVATSLLIGLEENAFLMANQLNYEKNIVHERRNILMEVRVLDARNLNKELEVFPKEAGQQHRWTNMHDRIELTRGALLRNNNTGRFVRLVFMAFDRLEEILQPQVESSYFAEEGSEFTSYSSSMMHDMNVSRILNSKVISASLGKGKHVQLTEPVILTFQHLMFQNVTNPKCVFWDYAISEWSEEGCIIRKSNETHTICECNHLTNFAVLMDIHAVKLDVQDQVALQIITYIGCIISIICLVLAIITFQLFRGLKSDRTTIHKNLCVCLLIAEVLFICGIGQTNHKIVCGIVAGLLHFFFLCAFAWMFLEGFQLYVMLIEVFEAEKSRLRWYYLVAYGIPLLVVGISSVIDPLSYGTDRYCWLRADNYFIFSFVGPVILVILANLVFLSMAIYMMCRHAHTTVSLKSKEHSRLASASGKEENALLNKLQSHLAWLRGAIMLVFLLGLTWTFGLLYLNQESIVMAYIFTTLNSLQGLFIFIFHCVQNEKVRKEYRKFVRQHSWLPKCLRCSKGSTSGISNTSVAGSGTNAGKDFASHNTSSNPSALTTNSSGLSSHINSNVGIGAALQTKNQNLCNIATSNNTNLSINMNLNNLSIRSQSHPLGVHQMRAMAPSNHNRHPSNQQAFVYCLYSMQDQHEKNISFKSHSRDSGQGGSEQEDSPHVLGHVSGYSHGIHNAMTLQGYSLRARERRLLSELEIGSRATTGRRANSPYNHTYTEIREPRHQQHLQCHGYGFGLRQLAQDDPVYEEIERTGTQTSDMSDEDCRRQSDMSRQSSRSYGDHRPLIPYSPATDRGLDTTWIIEKHKRHQRSFQNTDHQQQEKHHQQLRPQDHTRTVAVLDGHTVVCHLQPQTELFTARGSALPSYSEC